MRTRARALLAMAAVAWSVTPAWRARAARPPQSMPAYAVEPIRLPLPPDAKVGQRRAGLICLPAGTIVWRDAAPDPRRASAIVAHVLKDAAVDVYVPDEEWITERTPDTPYRIVASVEAVTISACGKHYGVASVVDRRTSLKGVGRMRVAWRVYDAATRARLLESQTCSAFDFDVDGFTLAQAAELGLGKNAGRFLSRIKHWSPGPGASTVFDDTPDLSDCPKPSASR